MQADHVFKHSYAEFRENPTGGLATDTRSQTDRRTGFSRKLCLVHKICVCACYGNTVRVAENNGGVNVSRRIS